MTHTIKHSITQTNTDYKTYTMADTMTRTIKYTITQTNPDYETYKNETLRNSNVTYTYTNKHRITRNHIQLDVITYSHIQRPKYNNTIIMSLHTQ